MRRDIDIAVQVAKAVTARTANRFGLGVQSVASADLAIKTWIRQLDQQLPALRGRVLLFTGRNQTWIEWTAYAACWLRKLGLASTLVYPGSDITRSYPVNGQRIHNRMLTGDFWSEVRNIPDIELIDFEQLPAPREADKQQYASFADDYAHTTAAYDLHVEERETGHLRGPYCETVEQHRSRLMDAGARFEWLCRDRAETTRWKHIICYSGLMGLTPAIVEASKRAGFTVYCVEGLSIKPGIMICNVNSPALIYDPGTWLGNIRSGDDWKGMSEFLQFQEHGDISDSDWLQDHLQYQRSTVNSSIPPDLQSFLRDERPTALLATNVVGDTATLRRTTLFESQRAWITQACRFFRGRPDLKLIVRAHPAEKLMRAKCVLHMGQIAREAAQDAPNIYVIEGHSDLSTYSLLPFIRVGLCWVSNIGVDLVIRNRPVVLAAKAQYSGMGLCHEPTDVEAYFELVERLIRHPAGTSPAQQELAKRFLTVLYRLRSFRAFGPSYRARGIDLIDRAGGDCETFYKILAGDLPLNTTPPTFESAQSE